MNMLNKSTLKMILKDNSLLDITECKNSQLFISQHTYHSV